MGLALFYHWWTGPSNDYSWPENGIYGSAQYFGNGNLITGNVDIGNSVTVPTLDGQCSSEYSDASSVNFNTPSGIIIAYLKHSLTDLYVCLHDLAVPAPSQQNWPNAALYIDRTGTGGDMPNAGDISFTISYSGTVRASTGDGSGFSGPDPGGYAIALSRYSGGWDAEFRINSATIGNWYPRSIGLAVAEQGLNYPGDDYGWPMGYFYTIPYSWGKANLTGLDSPHLYLSFING